MRLMPLVLASVGLCMVVCPTASPAEGPSPSDLRDFVCKAYDNGAVPFEQARSFGLGDRRSGSVSALRAILNSPKDAQCWSGAVWTLGSFGSDDAVEILKGFVLQGDGRLSRDEYNGKTSSVLALGWASNPSNATNKSNERAFQFLKGGMSPRFWGGVRWQSPLPGQHDPSSLSTYLARRSLQAIGLSGREDARAAMRDSPSCAAGSPLQPECEDADKLIERTKGGLNALYL